MPGTDFGFSTCPDDLISRSLPPENQFPDIRNDFKGRDHHPYYQ
jgi:hypothetical protein